VNETGGGGGRLMEWEKRMKVNESGGGEGRRIKQ
jgi:hypothetical protein